MIRTSRALVQSLGREPTVEEIAAGMEVPVAAVRKAQKVAQGHHYSAGHSGFPQSVAKQQRMEPRELTVWVANYRSRLNS